MMVSVKKEDQPFPLSTYQIQTFFYLLIIIHYHKFTNPYKQLKFKLIQMKAFGIVAPQPKGANMKPLNITKKQSLPNISLPPPQAYMSKYVRPEDSSHVIDRRRNQIQIQQHIIQRKSRRQQIIYEPQRQLLQQYEKVESEYQSKSEHKKQIYQRKPSREQVTLNSDDEQEIEVDHFKRKRIYNSENYFKKPEFHPEKVSELSEQSEQISVQSYEMRRNKKFQVIGEVYPAKKIVQPERLSQLSSQQSQISIQKHQDLQRVYNAQKIYPQKKILYERKKIESPERLSKLSSESSELSLKKQEESRRRYNENIYPQKIRIIPQRKKIESPERLSKLSSESSELSLKRREESRSRYNENLYPQKIRIVPVGKKIESPERLSKLSSQQSQMSFKKHQESRRVYDTEKIFPEKMKKKQVFYEPDRISNLSSSSSQLQKDQSDFRSKRIYDSEKVYPKRVSKRYHIDITSSDQQYMNEDEADVYEYRNTISFKPIHF